MRGHTLVWMMPRLMGHELPYFYRDVRDAHIRQTERFNWSKANSYRGRFSLRTFCNSISLCGFLRNALYSSYDWRRCFWFGINFLHPLILAEIAGAENRGKLVAIQQLNIVLGFFAAFLSNYYFNTSITQVGLSF